MKNGGRRVKNLIGSSVMLRFKVRENRLIQEIDNRKKRLSMSAKVAKVVKAEKVKIVKEMESDIVMGWIRKRMEDALKSRVWEELIKGLRDILGDKIVDREVEKYILILHKEAYEKKGKLCGAITSVMKNYNINDIKD